ncbi:MAG TPA: hypothetical protein ENI94_07355 [Gammaproteobacteria bacterium]|nr:hypothetical protein [Gammaproteobacteria bacterium]
MSKITMIELDIAKNIFHAMCCDARGKVVKKRMLKRHEVLAFFARLESCLIGVEACASAHYWFRPGTGPGSGSGRHRTARRTGSEGCHTTARLLPAIGLKKH